MNKAAEALKTLGWSLFGASFLLALTGGWMLTNDTAATATQVLVGAAIGGPILVAGAVLAVAGHIMETFRPRG